MEIACHDINDGFIPMTNQHKKEPNDKMIRTAAQTFNFWYFSYYYFSKGLPVRM